MCLDKKEIENNQLFSTNNLINYLKKTGLSVIMSMYIHRMFIFC